MATRGLPSWPWLDAEAADLPEAEALALDAMRAWAEGGAGGSMAQAALVLASAGAEGAALPLNAALHALPGLVPACRVCPGVSWGEADFLLALTAAQAGRRSLALAMLHRLAPPLAAYQAMPGVIGVACALRRSGLVFSAPF